MSERLLSERALNERALSEPVTGGAASRGSGECEAGLAYSAGPTDQPLIEESIGEVLRRIVARNTEAEAVVDVSTGERLSYSQLLQRVEALAKALLGSGLSKGDRVGIWSPNCIDWLILQYASAYVGVILVNVNPAYRTNELEYALKMSGCRALFSADSFKGSDYRKMVDLVRPGTPDLQEVVYFGDDSWSTFLDHQAGCDNEQLLIATQAVSAHEPINIQYTSGTTGFPKGATLSHRNIVNNGFRVGERCHYSSADRICVPVPFYHCFGMVMGNLSALTHGATVVIPGPSFEPGATLEAVSSERCTSLYGVPTMFIAELALPNFSDYDLRSLRTGIMAGSPCPVDTMRRVIIEMHISEITICYGMTETSPVSTQTMVDDTEANRVESVGRVHPHVEVQVADASSGKRLSRGEVGELRTRGYSVMLGYWNDPERTSQAIDDDGWMCTGDLAVMDADGYVSIVGRIKDMIIRGGENIYPRELEEFLLTHPEVEDVQVVGVPDEKYGEIVMAWIRTAAGSTLTESDIRAFCKGQIAHYKVPALVEFTLAFPETITGKIQKYKLREMAVELFNLQES